MGRGLRCPGLGPSSGSITPCRCASWGGRGCSCANLGRSSSLVNTSHG